MSLARQKTGSCIFQADNHYDYSSSSSSSTEIALTKRKIQSKSSKMNRPEELDSINAISPGYITLKTTKMSPKNRVFEVEIRSNSSAAEQPIKARHSVRILDATALEAHGLKMKQFELQHQMIHDLNTSLHSLMLKNGLIQEENDENWEEIARLNEFLAQRDDVILEKDANIKKLMDRLKESEEIMFVSEQKDNGQMAQQLMEKENEIRRKNEIIEQLKHQIQKTAAWKNKEKNELIAFIKNKEAQIERLNHEMKAMKENEEDASSKNKEIEKLIDCVQKKNSQIAELGRLLSDFKAECERVHRENRSLKMNLKTE